MIPEAAVEAAATLLHDREGYFELFTDAPSYRRERFLENARAALEAAAPYMLVERRPYVFNYDTPDHHRSQA